MYLPSPSHKHISTLRNKMYKNTWINLYTEEHIITQRYTHRQAGIDTHK